MREETQAGLWHFSHVSLESKCKHVHGALERAKELGDLRGGGNVA